ncbi:hypothetical protein [Plantactinospora sp. CA-290183]|uniref:hypothetical protein n=1 Tax=Plantactinospora sp. CA-290183 TaxID=3240006 RepID=UPI003D9127B3
MTGRHRWPAAADPGRRPRLEPAGAAPPDCPVCGWAGRAWSACGSHREWRSPVTAGGHLCACRPEVCQIGDAEYLRRFLGVMAAGGDWSPPGRDRFTALLADPEAARLVGRMVRSAPAAAAELCRYLAGRPAAPLSRVYDERVIEGLARLEERLADR